mmetsp:Transcript_29882/g.75275  ORF Transcript_29882/g.75275 Transcript_29882/m.75275 type:complete len:257 (-) Transcript_29882:380-1150(-)
MSGLWSLIVILRSRFRRWRQQCLLPVKLGNLALRKVHLLHVLPRGKAHERVDGVLMAGQQHPRFWVIAMELRQVRQERCGPLWKSFVEAPPAGQPACGQEGAVAGVDEELVHPIGIHLPDGSRRVWVRALVQAAHQRTCMFSSPNTAIANIGKRKLRYRDALYMQILRDQITPVVHIEQQWRLAIAVPRLHIGLDRLQYAQEGAGVDVRRVNPLDDVYQPPLRVGVPLWEQQGQEGGVPPVALLVAYHIHTHAACA